MKLAKKASGKTIVKMSKDEWQSIGRKAGWIKEAGPIITDVSGEGISVEFMLNVFDDLYRKNENELLQKIEKYIKDRIQNRGFRNLKKIDETNPFTGYHMSNAPVSFKNIKDIIEYCTTLMDKTERYGDYKKELTNILRRTFNEFREEIQIFQEKSQKNRFNPNDQKNRGKIVDMQHRHKERMDRQKDTPDWQEFEEKKPRPTPYTAPNNKGKFNG